MHVLAAFARLLLVALIALVVAACGDDDASPSGPASPGGAATEPDGDALPKDIDPGSPEAAEERTQGGGAFVSTPEFEACMKTAGWSADKPVAGAVAAFRHASGARAFVAASADTAFLVASEVGTDEAPANVDGTTVTTGADEHRAAAVDCIAG